MNRQSRGVEKMINNNNFNNNNNKYTKSLAPFFHLKFNKLK